MALGPRKAFIALPLTLLSHKRHVLLVNVALGAKNPKRNLAWEKIQSFPVSQQFARHKIARARRIAVQSFITGLGGWIHHRHGLA